MTYNPEIPLVTAAPKDSALPIQVNFSQFASIFSSLSATVNYNHMPLNDTNEGKHGAVIFQNQTLDPGVTDDYDVLYAKNATSSVSTEPQLFVQIPKFLPTNLDSTNAPNNPMQLTYSTVNTTGPIYYSFLPGGYIFYFGNVTGTALNPYTVTLSPTPTSIIACFAFPNTVEANSVHNPLKMSVVNNSPTGFKVYTNLSNGPATYNFNWMAIAQA
jgi:hypothetical protein